MSIKNDPFNKLDPYFLAYNKIDPQIDYDVFYLKPEEIINEKRIDIIVKYYYIKARESGHNLGLAREIYEKHIEAFSDGTFQEHGNKDKNSIEQYISTFNQLIDDFKENGFDEDKSYIPVGKDNEMLDGSHRAACALYYKQKIKVVKFPDLGVSYDFEFFRKRHLDEFYLDFIAKEYVNLKQETYVLFAWPKIGNHENLAYIDKMMNQGECRVIYKKKLAIDHSSLWHLIFNIYKDEHWIGYKGNGFKLVDHKRDLCYDQNGMLGVYLIECSSLSSLTEKKQLLRDYFAVEKSSVHTTDTYEESIEILDFILDKDYDRLLHEDFLNNRDSKYTFKKHVMRKLRYFYRKLMNIIKKIIGMPV